MGAYRAIVHRQALDGTRRTTPHGRRRSQTAERLVGRRILPSRDQRLVRGAVPGPRSRGVAGAQAHGGADDVLSLARKRLEPVPLAGVNGSQGSRATPKKRVRHDSLLATRRENGDREAAARVDESARGRGEYGCGFLERGIVSGSDAEAGSRGAAGSTRRDRRCRVAKAKDLGRSSRLQGRAA